MKILLKDIEEKAKIRPEGYKDEVLKSGTIEGNFLVITPDAYTELLKKFSPSTPIPPKKKCCGDYPPLPTQLGNAVNAGKRVLGAFKRGESVRVADQVANARRAICEQCQDFDKERGRCVLCGCYVKFKLMLKTEQCPRKLWA